jgi:hypothetical protein
MLDILYDSDTGAKYENYLINSLMYADDTILLANNDIELLALINIVKSYCDKFEIKLNMEKTVLMVVNAPKNKVNHLQFETFTIEDEQELKYLGYLVTKNMQAKTHVETRINNSIKKMYSLNTLGLNSKVLTPAVKAFIINAYCIPILYYSLENAMMTKGEEKDIRSTVGSMVKRSLGISSRCETTDLLCALDIRDPVDAIAIRKMKLFQRLLINETTKTLLDKENNAFVSVPIRPRLTLLEEIYKCTGISTNASLSLLNQQCVLKIRELDNKFKFRKKTDDYNFMKDLLESGELALIEELIMPEKIRTWAASRDIENSERVRDLRDYIELQEEMEQITDTLSLMFVG